MQTTKSILAGVPETQLLEHLHGQEYGCTKCQEYHVADREPELFMAHLMHQSKHGYHGAILEKSAAKGGKAKAASVVLSDDRWEIESALRGQLTARQTREVLATIVEEEAELIRALDYLLCATDKDHSGHQEMLIAEADNAANEERHPSWDNVKAEAFRKARAVIAKVGGTNL